MPLSAENPAKVEAAHTVYRLESGLVVPSVTQVLGMIPKPGLDRWANWQGRQGINTERLVRQMARGGTLLHSAIEAVLRGGEPTPEIAAEYDEREKEWARISYRQFLDWYATHEVEPVLMEHQMVSERLGVGGTLDLFAKVDGQLTVVDWKSSAAVRSSHLVQAAAYRALLEETSDHSVDAIRVLALPRDGRKWSETIVEDTSEHLTVFRVALDLFHKWKAVDG